MDIVLRTKTHLYEKYGHVFYNVTSTKVEFKLDGLKLRLDNLFDGVQSLGELIQAYFIRTHWLIQFTLIFYYTSTEDSTNQYLNENWRPVSDALKPILSKTIEDILLGILNKVFHFLPADYLISDIARPSKLYGDGGAI